MWLQVVFQGFSAGEFSGHGGSEVRAALAPHATPEDPSYWRIDYGDGTADITLGEGGMSAIGVSGRDPWDLLVRAAHAADWVIMPVGCPVCLTRSEQQQDLPDELAGQTVVVESGGDLVAVIEAA